MAKKKKKLDIHDALSKITLSPAPGIPAAPPPPPDANDQLAASFQLPELPTQK